MCNSGINCILEAYYKNVKRVAQEIPELHVVTAGSLLETKLNKDWAVPVGRVDYLYIYPLTFFEYLGAKGKDNLLETLKRTNLGDNLELHELVSEIFHEYLLIGGMPEVVKCFIAGNNYDEIKTILNRLQTAYLDDINKYAASRQDNKYLEIVVNSGPKIAGALFNYENFGSSSFRSREMGEALHTVEKVMLLRQIMAVNSTSLPLIPKSKRPKKMIWLDVGLANYVNNAYREIVSGAYKGKIMEQIVGQSLLASGTSKKLDLYYWSRNRDEGSAEVDFCLQYGARLAGIEIKSGNSSDMKSLFSLINSGSNVIPVRVSWDNLMIGKYEYAGKKYRILSLPFYLIDRWQDLIAQFIAGQ